MNRLRADMLLLLTAVIWGTTFVAQKNANKNIEPVLFIGIKFFLAALALVPLVLYEARRQTSLMNKGNFMVAGVIGLSLFTGSVLQQIGLGATTVSNAGFLTALYVVFVPLIICLMERKLPRPIVFIACMVSILGAWQLADNGPEKQWAMGEALVVTADIAWALAIALVPVFLKRTSRPFLLAFFQYSICAILGIVGGLFFEPTTKLGFVSALPTILYSGLFGGAIAFTLQIIAQRYTPAAEAALILSLEGVFAAIAGAVLLQEHLTLLAMIGCALILLGVILVEAGPVILQKMSLSCEVRNKKQR